mmetsp:Transcript_43835/g.73010  ORF Transcript_43835/g.73010 Transcript_43835/m.73010 type:complete len:111 (+) Transcript_43835:279-611(+)
MDIVNVNEATALTISQWWSLSQHITSGAAIKKDLPGVSSSQTKARRPLLTAEGKTAWLKTSTVLRAPSTTAGNSFAFVGRRRTVAKGCIIILMNHELLFFVFAKIPARLR